MTDGSNTIYEFGDNGTDVIDLTSFGLSGLGDLITSTDTTSTTVYLDEDTSITLNGVNSVTADDFLF